MADANPQPHFRTTDCKRRLSQLIYREVYSGAPAAFLLISPEFQILDANDAYLDATMRECGSLAGIDMFEAFPDNPELDDADAVANLRKSLIDERSSG